MWLDKSENQSKYGILLVAYKDIERENELRKHFISTIRDSEDIRDINQCGDFRGSAGLQYRTSLYHSWFKETIIEYLKKGYQLGIIEIRKDKYEEGEKLIRDLDKKYGENILIVDESEL